MKESKEIKGKSSVSLQAFLLLHGTLLLYAVVTVLTKLASGYLGQANWPMTLLFLFFSVAALGAYSLLWQQVLKRMPLNFAYSNKGVCTLWTCLFGILFFGESLTLGKAAGILVVLLGVWLVVTDHA